MGERCFGFVRCFDFVVFALLARRDFVRWDFVDFALPFSFSLRISLAVVKCRSVCDKVFGLADSLDKCHTKCAQKAKRPSPKQKRLYNFNFQKAMFFEKILSKNF